MRALLYHYLYLLGMFLIITVVLLSLQVPLDSVAAADDGDIASSLIKNRESNFFPCFDFLCLAPPPLALAGACFVTGAWWLVVGLPFFFESDAVVAPLVALERLNEELDLLFATFFFAAAN